MWWKTNNNPKKRQAAAQMPPMRTAAVRVDGATAASHASAINPSKRVAVPIAWPPPLYENDGKTSKLVAIHSTWRFGFVFANREPLQRTHSPRPQELRATAVPK